MINYGDQKVSSFGQNLKRLVHDQKVTVRQLAKELGVPQTSLNQWIGQKDAGLPRDPEVLRKLSTYFGCSVYELIFGEPDPLSVVGGLLEKTEVHTGLYEISIKRVQKK